jgi:hypothetical protein
MNCSQMPFPSAADTDMGADVISIINKGEFFSCGEEIAAHTLFVDIFRVLVEIYTSCRRWNLTETISFLLKIGIDFP